MRTDQEGIAKPQADVLTLNAARLETARRLVGSDQPAAQLIGRQAVKELSSPAVRRKLRG